MLLKKRHIVLLTLVLFGAMFCRRDPVWLADFKGVADTINRDLESVLPQLSPDRSPAEVLQGLKRLEEILDYFSQETVRVYRQYPEFPQQAQLVEEKLETDFKRLRTNAERTATAVNYWYKKFGKQRDFEDLLKRIGKKVGMIGSITDEKY